MNIIKHQEGSTLTVSLEGRLDTVTAPQLEGELRTAVSGIPDGWNHSRYNRKREAEESFFELLKNTPASYLMVSYNSEGFIGKDSFMAFLETLGAVTPVEIEYSAFRGSRNLRSRPLKVTEYLFLVKRRRLCHHGNKTMV